MVRASIERQRRRAEGAWRSLGSWPLMRPPWVRATLVAGVLSGLGVAGWVVVTALESWLFYQAIGREPFRTSHLRIAAKKAVSTLVEPVYDHRLAAQGRLPAYELVTSEKRAGEWRRMLDRVYARGFSEEQDQVWLPARFWHRGQVWEVDFRGRGTLFTHYKADKPSMRLRFPGDEYFRGLRATNLIIPYDQARVMYDTTINALARQEGLLTYPTRFVTLRMNGDMLGVYQEVPHFRKELAVHQFRSEGFFMSSLGDPKGTDLPDPGSAFGVALGELSRCVLHPCSEADARRLLDHYLDVDKLAAYMALTTLFGSSHAWGEDNLILFFDPPRGRLEPVPWDMGTLVLPRRGGSPSERLETVKGVGKLLLGQPDLRLARDLHIWDLVRRKRGFAVDESRRLYAELEPALALDTEHSRGYTRRFPRYFRAAVRRNFGMWQEHLERLELEVAAGAGGRLEVFNRAA
ncbi:MAG: CotH kinase family protein, partial [Holophagales bacterium]|nr:CotH kinase family protein [Holophagales bacterium]